MHLNAIVRGAFVSLLFLLILACGCSSPAKPAPSSLPASPATGPFDAGDRYIPTGQILSPAGTQIPLPRMRPQGLALSPNGRLLGVAGNSDALLLIDPRTGRTLQTISLTLITTEVRTNKATNVVAEVGKISNVKT